MPAPTYEQDLLALQMDRVNSDRHWNDVIVPAIRAHEWDPTPAPDLELVTIRAARFMRLNWPARRAERENQLATLTMASWQTQQAMQTPSSPLPAVPPRAKRQAKRRRR